MTRAAATAVFSSVGGLRLAVGERHAHPVLGNLERVVHLLVALGLELLADLARGLVAIVGERLGDPLLHLRADAGLGVGDAGPRGLLGLLENLGLRGADGLLALGSGLVEQLL